MLAPPSLEETDLFERIHVYALAKHHIDEMEASSAPEEELLDPTSIRHIVEREEQELREYLAERGLNDYPDFNDAEREEH